MPLPPPPPPKRGISAHRFDPFPCPGEGRRAQPAGVIRSRQRPSAWPHAGRKSARCIRRSISYSATSSLLPAGNWIMQMVAFRAHRRLVSIAVTPTNPSIAVGGHQQFTATGTYSDGSYQNLTNSATWTSSATSIATINSAGLATGVAAGNATITATYGSVYGSTTLTVTSSGGFNMSASPSSLSVAQGNQGTSTITTTVNNGFSGTISLAASGAPTGTTVTFNPSNIPAPGSGSSVMTIISRHACSRVPRTRWYSATSTIPTAQSPRGRKARAPSGCSKIWAQSRRCCI